MNCTYLALCPLGPPCHTPPASLLPGPCRILSVLKAVPARQPATHLRSPPLAGLLRPSSPLAVTGTAPQKRWPGKAPLHCAQSEFPRCCIAFCASFLVLPMSALCRRLAHTSSAATALLPCSSSFLHPFSLPEFPLLGSRPGAPLPACRGRRCRGAAAAPITFCCLHQTGTPTPSILLRGPCNTSLRHAKRQAGRRDHEANGQSLLEHLGQPRSPASAGLLRWLLRCGFGVVWPATAKLDAAAAGGIRRRGLIAFTAWPLLPG